MEIHTIRRPGHWQTFRERYCYSPWATLLTFVVGAVVCAVLFFLFRWGVWNAEWAADPAACAKADGACWGFVTEKWRLILFGRYPYEEQWRPGVAMALLLGMTVISAVPALWTRKGVRSLAVGWGVTLVVFFSLLSGGVAVFTRGLLQKLLILVGLGLSYLIYALLSNVLGIGGKPIDFSLIANAPWFGMPSFTSPVFSVDAIALIVPVVIILVGENLGHIKAVTAMTGRNLDPYMGRAFLGDGIATMVSGACGGTGVTTYGENIGVMAATRVYSTLIFPVAALFAIVLGFSPKFGAVIQTIPQAILGGTSIVVFGLIAVAGARVWVVNKVDFGDNRNLIVAAVTLILGGGDFTLNLGGFMLGGIGTATFGAILLNAIMQFGENRRNR